MGELAFGEETWDSRLTQLELDIISCGRNSMFEQAMNKCIELLAVSNMQIGNMSLAKAQYSCFVGFGYLIFRGPAFAAQAEFHADIARSIFVNKATDFRQTAGSNHATSEDGKPHEQTLLLIMLLTQYTLAKARTILKREKEALRSAEASELILNQLLAMEPQFDSTQSHRSCEVAESDTDLQMQESQLDTFLELYQGVSSPMLRPGGGFCPSLRDIQIRIRFLTGRCFANQKKNGAATKCYRHALDFIEQRYGEDCKESIPVYHALAQLAESKDEESNIEEAIHYYRKVYKIALSVANEERSVLNCIEVLLAVHRLSLAYLKSGQSNSCEVAEKLLKDTLEWMDTFADEDENVSFVHSQRLAQSENDRLLSLSYRLLQTQQPSETSSTTDNPVSDLKRKLSDLVCLIRSTLIKIYSDSRRYEEAAKLLRQNLATQQFLHGLYSPAALVSQKMLLSIAMVAGDLKDAAKKARECLPMEEFTFGRNSKQVSKTREILDYLSGFQACEITPPPRFK
ncbi:hypothetical protein CSKR_112947 [Clonorchis sinensis]|uniref:Tetratricopeptide repeat protein 23 n=1 Tax=Clonorchis sinensis TaxID=79923 RepID=A0A8T1MZ59_CLOSI|nr:hypothetical protein CSKR_112947 [Clonorchis sinensis]